MDPSTKTSRIESLIIASLVSDMSRLWAGIQVFTLEKKGGIFVSL